MEKVKKVIIHLMFIFFLSLLMVDKAGALTVESDRIPANSYVIGTHLFTDDDNDIFNTVGNENTIYNTDTGMTTPILMLASSTIGSNRFDDMVVYYYDYSGLWGDGATGADLGVPETFEITHVNGICIDSSCLGDDFKVTFEAQSYETGVFQTKEIHLGYGDKITSTQLPTLNNRPGYKFVCWTIKDSDECFDFTISITDDGNRIPVGGRELTLEIKWEQIGYKVTYDSNFEGGSKKTLEECYYYDETNPNNCKFALYDSLDIGENVKYHFQGWSLTKDGKTLYQPETEMSVILGNEQEITLYAIWSAKDYQVKYDLDGGTFNVTDEVVYGYDSETDQILLFNPTKVGYQFLGWTLNGKEFTGSNLPKNDIVLKARWEANTYTFKYNDQEKSCTYDEKCDLDFETQEIAGKNFLGLFLEDGSKLPSYVINFTTENGKVYTVHHDYETIKYAINYDYKGGSPLAANPSEFEFRENDENKVTLFKADRRGYDFVGYDVDGTATVGEDGLTVTINEAKSINVTAKWAPIEFSFTYEGKTTKCTYDEPCNLEFEEPQIDGKEFKYWYYLEKDEKVRIDRYVTNYTSIAKNYEIFAEVGDITYNIAYDYDGGAVSTPNQTSYTVAKMTHSLTEPTKKGYTFDGWTVSDNAEVNDGQLVINSVGNVSLTAKWRANEFTFTYNGKTVTCTYDEPCNLDFEEPKVDGQEFKYWYYMDNGEKVRLETYVTNYTSENKAYEVLAEIGDITYTITYEYDGGAVSKANETSYTVTNNTISLVLPTKTGYTFDGWTVSENAEIQDGKLVITGVGNVNVTAKWKANEFKFKYDGKIVTCTYDENCTLDFEEPTVEGKEFKYWYYLEDGKKVRIDTYVKNYTTEVKEYDILAEFGDITYNITYEYDGGTVATPNKSTYTISDNRTTLTSPTKTGYTFNGWDVSDNAEVLGNQLIISGTGTVTLTAKWTANKFSFTYKDDKKVTCTYGEECRITFEADPVVGQEFKYWYYLENGKNVKIDTNVTNYTTENKEYSIAPQYGNITYHIDYEYNGGKVSEANKTTYEIGEDIVLTIPTKVGYKIKEWITSDNAEIADGKLNVKEVGNVTVEVVWEPIVYTLRYTDSKTQTCTYDLECEITFEADAIAGKTFNYWYTGEGEAKKQISNYVMNLSSVDGDVIAVKADYVFNQYRVKYDLDGGALATGKENPDTVSYDVDGENTYTLESPVKLGYTFEGWAKGDESNVDVTGNTLTVLGVGEVKLVATWAPVNVTVRYYQDIDVAYGDPVTCLYDACTIIDTVPTKDGYVFDGWRTEDGLVYQGGASITADASYAIVLYAKWSKQYRNAINYDLDGGSLVDGSLPTTYVDDEVVTVPSPVKEGYIFRGWQLDGMTLEKNEAGLTVLDHKTGDVNLVALFDKITYTISFEYMGAKLGEDVVCTYDEPCNLGRHTLNSETRELVGWSLEEDGNLYYGDNIRVRNLTSEDGATVKLYAVTRDVTTRYTVAYNLNGGTATADGQTKVNAGSVISLFPVVVKDGYKLDGWLDAMTGEKFNESTPVTANLVLIAQWVELENYTITYDTNGGEIDVTSASTTVREGETIVALPTTGSKKGYKFVGWKDSETNETVTLETKVNANMTLVAEWEKVSYTITYNLDDGVAGEGNPTSYDIDTLELEIVNPTREGFKFLGWENGDSTFAVTLNEVTGEGKYTLHIEDSNGELKNITLTAKWEENPVEEGPTEEGTE